jgi:hypothetical protein
MRNAKTDFQRDHYSEMTVWQLSSGEFAVGGFEAFPNQLAVDPEDSIITVVR